MNYTKTVWKDLPDTSTPITADKLNNIEDGVEYLFEHGVANTLLNEYSASTTDGYSCNYINTAIVDEYSTNEVKTNKVWIDERPIYRKIISLEKNDLSSGLNSINHNISNLEDIITIYGTLKRTDNNVQNLIPWDTTNTDWKIFVSDISSTSFGLTLGSNSYLYLNRLNIVLEYTKSTDNTGGTSSGGNR